MSAKIVPFKEVEGAVDVDDWPTPGCMDEPYSWDDIPCNLSAPACTFKPSSWYFRHALRNAVSLADAVTVGLQMALELEVLKSFIRNQGMIPPKRHVLAHEVEDKGWQDQVEPRR